MDRYEFCRYAYQMVVEVWSNIFQKLFFGVCISVTGENKKKKKISSRVTKLAHHII